MTSTLTPDDLVAVLSPSTYMEIFDDENTNDRATVDTSPGVVACLDDVDAEIASWVENLYPGANIPASVSKLIAHARRRYAMIVAFQRRPEVARTYGGLPLDGLYTQHVERMERIQKSIQRIPAVDSPPVAPPPNVGGYVGSGNPLDPLPKPKTFLDGTGDF